MISQRSWLLTGAPFEAHGGRLEKIGLILLLILASGVFDDKHGKNPIGLPYVLEISIIILGLISSILILYALSNRQLKQVDFAFFLLIVGSWLLSAINAYLWHEQPLHYGLIEDRRILLALIYFPVVSLLRRKKIDAHDIVESLLIVAGISIVLSIVLVSMGVVDEQVNTARLEAREDRVSIGTHIVIIVTLMSFTFLLLKSNYKYYWMSWFIASYGTLLFIVQTRKIILVVTLIMVATLLKNRISTVVMLTIVAAISIVIFWPLIADETIVLKMIAVWGQLFDENYLTSSARANTISVIWNELTNVYFVWGQGALSLQWNEGFHRIYGEYFYLADVGHVGFLFRYGLPMTLLFMVISILLAYRAAYGMENTPLKRLVVLGLFFVFLTPGAGVFLYGGLQYGLLLGIAVGLSSFREYEQIRNRLT